MSKDYYEELKRLIEQSLMEFKEDIQLVKREVLIMRTSLLQCQSHCHVRNEEKSA